jgi:hypothetical protein
MPRDRNLSILRREREDLLRPLPGPEVAGRMPRALQVQLMPEEKIGIFAGFRR